MAIGWNPHLSYFLLVPKLELKGSFELRVAADSR
jgi:hypothetical protein